MKIIDLSARETLNLQDRNEIANVSFESLCTTIKLRKTQLIRAHQQLMCLILWP